MICARPVFREGIGRKSRDRSEDGADDHPGKTGKSGVCAGGNTSVRQILESARAGVARTVNTTQAVANWLIGREIVQEEQLGKKRAGYGRKVLADLCSRC